MDFALTGGGRVVVANDYHGAFLYAQGAESGTAIIADFRPLGGGCGLAVTDDTVVALEVGHDLVSVSRTDSGLVQQARREIGGAANDIAFIGDDLFVAAEGRDGARVDVLDLSDPARPVERTALPTDLRYSSLAVDGDRIVVLGLAQRDGFFEIRLAEIDRTDPLDPVIGASKAFGRCGEQTLYFGSFITPHFVEIAAFGGRLAAAIAECGTTLLDWDEGEPVVVGEADLWGIQTHGAPLFDDDLIIHATGYDVGLAIVDASDPSGPVLRSRLTWREGTPPDGSRLLARLGDRVFMADGRDVVVVDVADRDRPEVLGRIVVPGGRAESIATDGATLVVAADRAGLIALDPSVELQPLAPTPAPSASPDPSAEPRRTSTPIGHVIERLYLPWTVVRD